MDGRAAVEGKRVQRISVNNLRFDPKNPRLPHSVSAASELEVLRWMLEDGTILELMGSIGAQGYFEGEPILAVSTHPGGGPPYHVVEGNRRLAAVRLLGDPSLAPVRRSSVSQTSEDAEYRPDALPALIFDERNEVLDYLGFRHVTGIKPWDPLAKARYVRQLVARAQKSSDPDPIRLVAKKIGTRSDYVGRLLQGLAVYEHAEDLNFYDLKGLDEDDIDFAVLTTALSYSAIAQFVGVRAGDPAARDLNDSNLRDVFDWLFRPLPNGRTVVGESRNLKELAAVVASTEAVGALRAGEPLRDAVQLTEEPLRQYRQSVRQSRDRLERARSLVHRVRQPVETDLDVLAEIGTITRDLRSLLRTRMEEADEDE